MKNHKLLDLYSDYLLSSFGQVTATGLSRLLDEEYSHDQISRFLAQKQLTQKQYWQLIKPIIRKVESNDQGILAIDDTIEEKPHSTENALICWHWDHSKKRNIKGINILNFLYCVPLPNGEWLNIPVAYELIEKTEQYFDLKTQKLKRKSPIKKNTLVRNRLRILLQNNRLNFRYITWDTWFSSKENFVLVHQLNKTFVAALKDNRTIALSKKEKLEGKFTKIQTLDIKINRTYEVWLKGLPFPVLLSKQVFTNKDGSSGTLYLVTNDLTLSYKQICTIYQKRWNVEVFHKSLKQNASLAKSPTKYEVTQANHIFVSMIAFCKLEMFKVKEKVNHFALKSRLYLKAIKAAFEELQLLKAKALSKSSIASVI